MTYHVPHYIGGKCVEGSGSSLDIFNPAEGKKIGRSKIATPSETHSAILAAHSAFPAWSAIPVAQRAEIFFKYHALLRQNIRALAELISKEHGKTLADALGEMERGIEVVKLACAMPSLLKGEYTPAVAREIDTYSIRQPLGVCVGITPFNFPAMIGLWMFPLALAAGNTFIWKPSEKNPGCSIRLAELMKEAGLPDGVLNIVQGDKTVVDILISHPHVKAVSFVGSTPIAHKVYQTATEHGKRVQCGGSAKNIALILPDANLDEAAQSILGAAYGSAGERCMAISAVIAIGDAVGDAFVEKIKPLAQRIKIGDGRAPETEMGPLISAAHRERVKSYVDLGLQEGAQLVLDGRSYQNPQQSGGYYLGASLLDQVKPEMRVFREEIFGPVLSVLRAPDVETAIRWVNEHEYGNGTAIFTRDGFAAHEFAMRVQVGMVGINVPIPVPVGYYSFGGWKSSFFGDTGMYGAEGIRFYTQIKTITQRWTPLKQADFNIPT